MKIIILIAIVVFAIKLVKCLNLGKTKPSVSTFKPTLSDRTTKDKEALEKVLMGSFNK